MSNEIIKRIRVLLIEDNRGDARLVKEMLSETQVAEFDLIWVDRLATGLQRLIEERVDLVLLDLSLPDSQGFQTFSSVHERAPEVPIVLLTGLDNEALAIRAMQAGAQDYLSKGELAYPMLARTIRYAIGRKQAERALQESEARYRSIVETAQEGIWMLDATGKTTYVNEKMAEMLGYTPSEMLGRSLFEFMDDAARIEAERYFERRRQGVEEQHDFRFRRKDGSDLDTLVSTNPLLDAKGQFVGALGMIADITERKRAEGEREKLLRELQEALAQVKTLSGLLPICASCNKIRDDQGYWNQLEGYFLEHSELKFSHGLCPECAKKLYPEYFNDAE